jgi:hypothetical protein
MTVSKPQAALPTGAFRSFQTAVVPGLDGLHRATRCIVDDRLNAGATILVVGAGGGRELQTLFERLEPIYARHAMLGGTAPEQAKGVAGRVGTMPVVSAAVTRELLARSGFRLVTLFFRGLWYAGWWGEAA